MPPMLGRAVGSQVIHAVGVKPEKPSEVIQTGNESLIGISMTDAAAMFGVSRNVIAKRNRPGAVLQQELELIAA